MGPEGNGGAVSSNIFRKGDRVIVVEGPSRGEYGIILKTERKYDLNTQSTGWRVLIELDDQPGDKPNTLETRLAWVRKL